MVRHPCGDKTLKVKSLRLKGLAFLMCPGSLVSIRGAGEAFVELGAHGSFMGKDALSTTRHFRNALLLTFNL